MAEGAVANSEGDDVRQSIIAVICVGFSVILTSCGGGSSSGMMSVPVVTAPPTPTPTPTPDPTPEPMPGPSEGSLLPEIEVTSVVSDDFYVDFFGQRIWGESSCDAASCILTIQILTQEIQQEIQLEELSQAIANPATEIGEVTMMGGVQSATVRLPSDNFSLEGYGAWGEYQLGFMGKVDTAFSGLSVNMVVPFVIGTEADTNPVSGSATWTGTMMGKDHSDTLGNDVFGDARIVVNFADLNLNVLFSNIVGRTTNETFEDMNWPGLMMENGRFSGEGIQGQFFGPNHEEAAGVFNASNILGAFGTTRE